MTLTTLCLYVGIAALILTLIVVYFFKNHKSVLMSYAQNFVGVFFIVSGIVKAVDPLGTAYKMTDYFVELEATFQGTLMKFIAPIFPLLNNYVIAFSVFMIVFEIVLGMMLILGHKPKFTAWSFLILVGVFTFLTGYTYLTGYVPEGVNFFSFGSWGEYKESNMKVTDCGCFGDFIKLPPRVTFLKDIFLLIPGLYFLFKPDSMHQLWGKNVRNIGLSILTIGLVLYSFSNYVWDIPNVDFRPFSTGKDIYAAKIAEEEAQANVQIVAYQLTNKTTGERLELPYAQYMQEFQKYPTTEWNLEQLTSIPAIAHSKLSEFDVFDLEQNNINEDILNNDKPVLFLVAYKLFGDGVPSTKIVKDTLFVNDTIRTNNQRGFEIKRNIDRINERTVNYTDYAWKDYYADRYTNVVLPFVREAQADGVEVIMAIGQASEDQILDFKKDIGMDITYGLADDILLKTIVRSNPGIVLIDKGKLLDKWHYKKLPNYKEVKEQYLNR